MSNIEPDKGNSEKRSLKLITSSKFSSLNVEKDTRIPDLSVVTMELKKWSNCNITVKTDHTPVQGNISTGSARHWKYSNRNSAFDKISKINIFPGSTFCSSDDTLKLSVCSKNFLNFCCQKVKIKNRLIG